MTCFLKEGKVLRLTFDFGGFIEYTPTKDETLLLIGVEDGFCILTMESGEVVKLPIVSTVVITDPKTNFPATFGGRISCEK